MLRKDFVPDGRLKKLLRGLVVTVESMLIGRYILSLRDANKFAFFFFF